MIKSPISPIIKKTISPPFLPKIAGGITARYFRFNKTNDATGRYFHNEIAFLNEDVQATLTAGMISAVGCVVFANENFIDGSTLSRWGYSLNPTEATITVDFGAGNEQTIDKIRLYIEPEAGAIGAAPIYDLEYSDDGSTWSTFASNLDTAGIAGWKDIAPS